MISSRKGARRLELSGSFETSRSLSSQTDGACAAPTNQAKVTNLIFNLQFQIPSLLQGVLKLSVSDFAFLHIYTLLMCWEKLFNFPNSRGPSE
jgi:hypothetical protein